MAAVNTSIQRLMEDIQQGHLVLPDFQRSFIWKPDDVQDLLISVLGNFYVGSMLYMDAIRDEAPFALRMIEGVGNVSMSNIVKILLDGQQRTSSLFYALYAPRIPLSGRKNPYEFYIRVPALLNQDWENAVEPVNSGNRKAVASIALDDNFLGVPELRDAGTLSAKILRGQYASQIADLLRIVNQFMTYEIQMVHLDRGTSLDRVVETFERINRTGEPLSISDLLVAKLYRDNIKMRDMLSAAADKYEFTRYVDSEFILRVICLLRGVDVRRKSILDLSATGFREDWTIACDGLEMAYKRLTDVKNGYGVMDFRRWTPFSTMIVPLAAFMAYLQKNELSFERYFRKIDTWYWTSVFQSRYNEGVNTTISSDFTQMLEWFKDEDKVPDYILKSTGLEADLRIEARTSSIYKGVICLIVLAGALDFQTGQAPQFSAADVQDDHIFPKSLFNSDVVANRTLLSTNQKKSNQTPSRYFGAIETLSGRVPLEGVLKTHLIDANGLSALLGDDLNAFVDSREQVIRSRIAEVTQSENYRRR